MYIKQKDIVHPRNGHEDREWEQRYSSTLSLIMGLDGGGWSNPSLDLANLLPEKGHDTHCVHCMP